MEKSWNLIPGNGWNPDHECISCSKVALLILLIDGQLEIIQSMLYPVHDVENKVYIMPPEGTIVTSETQKLILSESVSMRAMVNKLKIFPIYICSIFHII